MEKKVYVKRYPRDRKDYREDRHETRERQRERVQEEFRRPERPVRRDTYRKPPRPDMGDKPRVFHKSLRRPNITQKTKMFTSKEDLVTYVNSIGEEGNRKIDVYKIEDDLYKVVIIEKKMPQDIEEVEIEELEDINEDIDVEIK